MSSPARRGVEDAGPHISWAFGLLTDHAVMTLPCGEFVILALTGDQSGSPSPYVRKCFVPRSWFPLKLFGREGNEFHA